MNVINNSGNKENLSTSFFKKSCFSAAPRWIEKNSVGRDDERRLRSLIIRPYKTRSWDSLLKAQPPEAITATRNALICTHSHAFLLLLFSPSPSLLTFFFRLPLVSRVHSIVSLRRKINPPPKKKRMNKNPTVRVCVWNEVDSQMLCMYTGGVLCKCNCQVQVVHFLLYTTIEVVVVLLVVSFSLVGQKRESE